MPVPPRVCTGHGDIPGAVNCQFLCSSELGHVFLVWGGAVGKQWRRVFPPRERALWPGEPSPGPCHPVSVLRRLSGCPGDSELLTPGQALHVLRGREGRWSGVPPAGPCSEGRTRHWRAGGGRGERGGERFTRQHGDPTCRGCFRGAVRRIARGGARYRQTKVTAFLI